MARSCDLCNKKAQNGKKITVIWGLKYRSIRKRQPNLRKTKLDVDGLEVYAKVCAKCLKTVKNGKVPGVKVMHYQTVETVTTEK